MPKADWPGLYRRFAELVTRWQAAYREGAGPLRQFWEQHGCVRCIHEIHDDLWIGGDLLQYKKLQKTLDAFDKPSSRRPDRFYCQRHTVPLDAGMAFYPNTAFGLGGHVGFGMRIPDVTYRSYPKLRQTESKWYTDSFAVKSGITGPGVVDPQVVPDPLERFRKEEYTAWKPMKSEDGNFEEAILHSLDWAKSPYSLFGQNCLNEAHDMLTAFGVQQLPLPTGHTPLSYFKHVFVSDEIELNPSPPVPEVFKSAATKSFISKVLKINEELVALGGGMRLSNTGRTELATTKEQMDELVKCIAATTRAKERKAYLDQLDFWLRHARLVRETSETTKRVIVTIDVETGFATGDVA